MKKLLVTLALLAFLPLSASAQLSVTQGGTGRSSFTGGDFIYANSDAFQRLTGTTTPFFSLFSFGSATGTSATTTNFAITGITSHLLKTNSLGSLVAAISNTDYQAPITLTTTGTSGVATFDGTTLNIPQYAGTTYTATWPITLSGSAFGFNGLATTSNPTAGNLFYSNGTNGLVPIATSSPTIDAPLTTSGTAGFLVSGSGFHIGCQTASGSQPGCLSSADWTTFNNKLSSAITAIGPLGQTQSGATITIASSTTGTDFSVTGSGNTLTWNLPTASASNRGLLSSTDWSTFNGKLSTIGSGTTGNIAYWTGTNALAGAATTTASCSGSVSCTSFTILGGSPITLTGSASTFPFTPTTNYGAAANSTSTPIWFTAGLQASTTNNYLAGLTVDNAFAGDALSTYGATSHEWSLGAKSSDLTFRVSSSTALGTSDVFEADKSLNVFLPHLTSNGFVKTSGGTGQLSVDTTSYLSTIGSGTNGQLAYWTGANTLTGVATSSASCSSGISCTTHTVIGSAPGFTLDQSFGAVWTAASTTFTGGVTIGTSTTTNATTTTLAIGSALQWPYNSPGLSYATSTSWTGTTTIQLPPSFQPQKWDAVQCFTDAGTLNVDFYHTSTHLALLNASTTVGTFTWSTNNTMTAGEKRYVDIGTPATSPTKISCTIKAQITSY